MTEYKTSPELPGDSELIMNQRPIVTHTAEELVTAIDELNQEAVFGMGMKDERGILWPSEIEVVITKGVMSKDNFEVDYKPGVAYPSTVLVRLLVFRTQKDKDTYIARKNSFHQLIYKNYEQRKN